MRPAAFLFLRDMEDVELVIDALTEFGKDCGKLLREGATPDVARRRNRSGAMIRKLLRQIEERKTKDVEAEAEEVGA